MAGRAAIHYGRISRGRFGRAPDDNYGTHNVTKVRTYHVHFTPASGSWLNLAERLFAEVTERCVRRASHTTIRSLEKGLLDCLQERSEAVCVDRRWRSDFGKIPRLSKSISDSGH